MKIFIAIASFFACATSLSAQISATLQQSPEERTEIRVQNQSSVNLVAFAIGLNFTNRTSQNSEPITKYFDLAIGVFPAAQSHMYETITMPLLPRQEFTISPEDWVAVNRRSGRPTFQQLITAGIFADGTTTGDPVLLSRLTLRRSNMMLAVEKTLETLSSAGKANISREQLIAQFKKEIESVRRWYLPAEQQVGLGLYQSTIAKLMHLPEGANQLSASFVDQETTMLRQQCVALMESQPGLVQ